MCIACAYSNIIALYIAPLHSLGDEDRGVPGCLQECSPYSSLSQTDTVHGSSSQRRLHTRGETAHRYSKSLEHIIIVQMLICTQACADAHTDTCTRSNPTTHGEYSDVVKCSVEGAMSGRYLPSTVHHWIDLYPLTTTQPQTSSM